jgi:hypothetical protein
VAPGPLASASPFPDARELELEREPGRARLRFDGTARGLGTREPAAGGRWLVRNAYERLLAPRMAGDPHHHCGRCRPMTCGCDRGPRRAPSRGTVTVTAAVRIATLFTEARRALGVWGQLSEESQVPGNGRVAAAAAGAGVVQMSIRCEPRVAPEEQMG